MSIILLWKDETSHLDRFRFCSTIYIVFTPSLKFLFSPGIWLFFLMFSHFFKELLSPSTPCTSPKECHLKCFHVKTFPQKNICIKHINLLAVKMISYNWGSSALSHWVGRSRMVWKHMEYTCGEVTGDHCDSYWLMLTLQQGRDMCKEPKWERWDRILSWKYPKFFENSKMNIFLFQPCSHVVLAVDTGEVNLE